MVFIPNYGVSVAEVIIPAADISEQISTAGKEASGTGNMKLMMNGAITLGTLDGANIEICEAVDNANFFLFGLTADAVETLRHHYQPHHWVEADESLQRVLALLKSGYFNAFAPKRFDPLLNNLENSADPWLTLADFTAYREAQTAVATAYRDKARWQAMSILNTAASGHFSSDRTIGEYNRDLWHLNPVVPQPTLSLPTE